MLVSGHVETAKVALQTLIDANEDPAQLPLAVKVEEPANLCLCTVGSVCQRCELAERFELWQTPYDGVLGVRKKLGAFSVKSDATESGKFNTPPEHHCNYVLDTVTGEEVIL